MHWQLSLAVIGCAAITAGCTVDPGSAPDPGSTATRPAPGGSARNQTMVLRGSDELTSTRPLAWDSWRLVGPSSVELSFLAGPASCEGVTAKVEETPDAVTIDLLAGALQAGMRCATIALDSVTTVQLGQPLGNRQVRQTA